MKYSSENLLSSLIIESCAEGCQLWEACSLYRSSSMNPGSRFLRSG